MDSNIFGITEKMLFKLQMLFGKSLLSKCKFLVIFEVIGRSLNIFSYFDFIQEISKNKEFEIVLNIKMKMVKLILYVIWFFKNGENINLKINF